MSLGSSLNFKNFKVTGTLRLCFGKDRRCLAISGFSGPQWVALREEKGIYSDTLEMTLAQPSSYSAMLAPPRCATRCAHEQQLQPPNYKSTD